MITNIYGNGIAVGFSSLDLHRVVLITQTQAKLIFKQVNNIIQSNNGYLSSKTQGWRVSIQITLLNITDSDFQHLKQLFEVVIGQDQQIYVYPFAQASQFDVHPKYKCSLVSNIDIQDIFERIQLGQYVNLIFESTQLLDELPYYTIT